MTRTIRRLRTEEWREFRALRLAALRDAPTAFGSTYEEQSRLGDEYWQGRAKQGAEAADAMLFVADDGALRGMAWGVVDHDVVGVAHLYGMFVDPALRGRGVGRALVDAVTGWARQVGSERVVLDVTEVNAPAIALYERCRFVRTGRTQPLPHTPSITEIEMELRLVRIWHQGFVELDTVPEYAASLAEHIRAVAPAGTAVDIHGLAPGTYTPWGTAADLARDERRVEEGRRQVVDNIVRAEREGYAAAAITIVQNIGMREARAAVRIPVASYGEAAMRAASRSGRFALVVFDEGIAHIAACEAETLGHAGDAVLTELVDAGYGDVVTAFARPDPLVAAFAAAARRAVSRGARAIVPGQTIMAEALWRNGLRDVDGIPVVDPIAVTLADAARMVRERAAAS